MARRLRTAERWLLLLDYDGTLAPIHSRPLDSHLAPGLRRTLGRLAGCRRARIYVISGRPLAYLQRTVNLPGVRLLGLHGWERRGISPPLRERKRLIKVKGWLEQQVSSLPGIRIEDKGLALAIHYRGAGAPAVRAARQVILKALDRFLPSLCLLQGRKIWELLPPFIDGKGAAAQRLLAQHSRRWLPICAGDDASDESAFAVIRRGLTIHVGGDTGTRARFWLRDPREVGEFLKRLEAESA